MKNSWWSVYGVPGRVSAGIVCVLAAVYLAAVGKVGAALVLVVFAALEFASAWRYSRKHGSSV
jgi:hypothetical protein